MRGTRAGSSRGCCTLRAECSVCWATCKCRSRRGERIMAAGCLPCCAPAAACSLPAAPSDQLSAHMLWHTTVASPQRPASSRSPPPEPPPTPLASPHNAGRSSRQDLCCGLPDSPAGWQAQCAPRPAAPGRSGGGRQRQGSSSEGGAGAGTEQPRGKGCLQLGAVAVSNQQGSSSRPWQCRSCSCIWFCGRPSAPSFPCPA